MGVDHPSRHTTAGIAIRVVEYLAASRARANGCVFVSKNGEHGIRAKKSNKGLTVTGALLDGRPEHDRGSVSAFAAVSCARFAQIQRLSLL